MIITNQELNNPYLRPLIKENTMRIFFTFLIIALLTACSKVSSPLPTPSEVQLVPNTQEGIELNMAPTTSTPYDHSLQSLVESAKLDLAQKLNISGSEISVVDARAIVWPDASLGCPQPGMLYKQVPEDGTLIILQVEGINYRYHNGGNRELFLCETIYKDPNPPPKIDIFNLTPSKSESDPTTPDQGIPPGEDQ